MENCKKIFDLPDEIIALILHKIVYNDIISFGMTCKQFHNVVSSDQSLWKTKCFEILPHPILKTVQKYCNGDWFKQIKDFIVLKKIIISELLSLSPTFFWKMNSLTLDDTVKLFKLATKDELSYYYTIHVLQQVIQISIWNLNKNICEKPYTLTEQRYAKIVLSYLMHTFLGIKWARMQAAQMFNEQQVHPEVVINFCVQWIDPAHFFPDETVDDVLNKLVDDVKHVIQQSNTNKPVAARKEITKREILYAVSQVLYGQRHIAITAAADLDTLNIVKVLNNKCGHTLTLAIIYHAVARKCGVKIKLIAFPNHLYLEWKDETNVHNKLYTISLATGELKPKQQCPFTSRDSEQTFSYCSSTLLKYIYTHYLVTVGAIKTWNVQNCQHLLSFLGACDNYLRPYNNFLPYLMEIPEICSPDKLLDIKYLENFYREIILTLTSLNSECISGADTSENLDPKKHDKNVLFAVGMICYHKKFEYVCIIQDWYVHIDPKYSPDMAKLEKQPYYSVISADHAERYLAQENLIHLPKPNRLYHLEDQISRHFCHFDGFAYVLNDEKRIQYPDEAPIVEMYRNHSFNRP